MHCKGQSKFQKGKQKSKPKIKSEQTSSEGQFHKNHDSDAHFLIDHLLIRAKINRNDDFNDFLRWCNVGSNVAPQISLATHSKSNPRPIFNFILSDVHRRC